MTASRLHLVRHGEVHNPARVLYGRLPDYHLSESGRRMARAAAEHIASLDRPVRSLRCSPLERTQESAEPFTELFGLAPTLDERIIEPTNVFEGRRMSRALRDPRNWWHLRRPSLPSWGEAYSSIAQRMQEAMNEAWHGTVESATEGGDIVFVSHQAPIWITHLSVAGLPLRHDPRTRRCALSSVTSFERVGDVWREVDYAEPAPKGIDLGAV
ncbi:histidine phosphatase family protein [Microbacterium esteraromaticum]|uniref:Histidine phosphatase family protein n=1 Tax=Microbacterium esteraromaticum TaxID=57043 RepID=A0A939DVY0_9MICO|nr:histidine phosphatase family protein [Microbacterium esteraromaticum]MBN7793476.1 histidine phosphatase family protein [Microbacterium esteraromaticum]MBN8205262.1 histidine phosphatase family protein [Microbacterium esteraromaticum]MBN8415416.1 histidine phosphatase family protein [Microbacterium esteraromaticum]MBN8424235.1 histidine phosphatase family protein [Microbacterium esteraromaticum]MCA1305409.1 histidine phosphatase family protein [Microbacterium esteraromaticum]